MITAHTWPMPSWLADLPPVEADQARARFLLGLATLYLDDKATPPELSTRLGLHKNHINVLKTRGVIPVEYAVKLELLLGRELFPRELFRPDMFVLPAGK